MYTFSLKKVTSVEQMLISLSGAVLADGHFYHGRDKIFLKMGSARSEEKPGVYTKSVWLSFLQPGVLMYSVVLKFRL